MGEVFRTMNRQGVIDKIRAIRLPATQYVVVGGAALSIRDLRDTDDIDFVVTPELFELLLRSGWRQKIRPNGKPGLHHECFEAYLDVNTETFNRSTSWLIENSGVVHGIPCVDLETLVGWKRTYGRDKDLRDVKMIESLVGGQE